MKKGLIVVGAILMLTSGVSVTDGTKPIWEKIPTEAETYKPRTFSCRDEQILLRVATAEAENQHTEGMKKVMEVVLNRVASPNFPNTIEEVVFQDNAFPSVHDGRYYKVQINENAYKALQIIKSGEPLDTEIVGFDVNGNDTLLKYFDYKYTVGCHNFYVEKARDL